MYRGKWVCICLYMYIYRCICKINECYKNVWIVLDLYFFIKGIKVIKVMLI